MEFIDFNRVNNFDLEHDGFNFDLVYTFIESGHTQKLKNSSRTRATHIKAIIKLYSCPENLTANNAHLLDTYVDTLDKSTAKMIKKSLSTPRFKRESVLSHEDYFKIIMKFFECADNDIKKLYLAAMVIQGACSLRISNVLPSVAGDTDYSLSSRSFNFMQYINKNTYLMSQDHQVCLMNSKTGSFSAPCSRLCVWPIKMCLQIYGHGEWFKDLSYDTYAKHLREVCGSKAQTHDLRRVIPNFAAKLLSNDQRSGIRRLGNWKSQKSAELYSNETGTSLQRLFETFVEWYNDRA